MDSCSGREKKERLGLVRGHCVLYWPVSHLLPLKSGPLLATEYLGTFTQYYVIRALLQGSSSTVVDQVGGDE